MILVDELHFYLAIRDLVAMLLGSAWINELKLNMDSGVGDIPIIIPK